jgi:predicted glutamine amidotransferase
MCRWAAYIGAPIFIEELMYDPSHSLVKQSKEAEECKTAINADGFGLAWYLEKFEPGLYRDVYPAWSDPNLRSVATQIRSGLFLAHVRASTGSAISRNNCHPFVVDNWSFMHNGQMGGFENFRKKADMLIPDELYQFRKGATDSEVLFLLALGHGLRVNPILALKRAASELQNLSEVHGTGPAMRLSAALSDGKSLYAVRYASDNRAPSLYYRRSVSGKGWAVVSEPLDLCDDDWIEVKNGEICSFTQDEVHKDTFSLDAKISALVGSNA